MSDPTTAAAFLAAAFLATAFIAGLARGFSGFGAALIFMPLASALVGPTMAAAVLSTIDIILAAPFIPKALKSARFAPIVVMLAGAAITVPVGAAVLKFTDPTLMRWLIAAVAMAMLLLLASGWRYCKTPGPVISFAVGATSGLFSGIAQIGGPPVVAFWLGGKGDPTEARAKIILFFAGSGLISLITYIANGMIGAASLHWAANVGPGYGLGLFFGAKLFGKASPETFRRICLCLIALAVVLSLPIWR